MLETTERLLSTLSALQGTAAMAGPELAARLGVTVRTVRRDVERLRQLGYAVESTRGPAGGYRLGRGGSAPKQSTGTVGAKTARVVLARSRGPGLTPRGVRPQAV